LAALTSAGFYFSQGLGNEAAGGVAALEAIAEQTI
jgi:hypothetical protein